MAKKRLDVILVERALVLTRTKAQALIMAGQVTVNGQKADKAGMQYDENVDVTVHSGPPFVSRGGDKLAAALSSFAINVKERVAVDVGASTGGFTDCLLQAGIARVYAIDVGYGQLAHKLREDKRVVVMERTNARHVETLPEPIELVVIDASFISLTLLLPVVRRWLIEGADVIVLIKPQFEAGKSDIGKKGVVRQPEVHAQVLSSVLRTSQDLGYSVRGLMASPIRGLKEGNREFLAWLRWKAPTEETEVSIDIDHEIAHVTGLLDK